MANGAMGVSCLRSVAKCSGLASEDVRRRPYAKTSKCGSRIKGHNGISAVANDQSIKPRIQSILTPHSLLRPQRFMRIIWKSSIHHCVDVVLLIADAPIPMQKTRHDCKSDWMSTGLCIILSARTLQHVKSLRWH